MASNLKVNNILPTSGGGTVNLGASGDTITVPSGTTLNVSSATLSGITQGITEADMWRLTADIVGVGTADITANLERVDDATFAKIGTGMAESSGIFTFPSTGLYLVSINVYFDSRGNDGFGNVTIKVSSDTGSNFDDVAQAQGGNDNGSRVTHTTSTQTFVNVTNTSTFQVKFTVGSQTFNDVKGDTDFNETCFTFIRLGDSQ